MKDWGDSQLGRSLFVDDVSATASCSKRRGTNAGISVGEGGKVAVGDALHANESKSG
jgi:hypothetical protein